MFIYIVVISQTLAFRLLVSIRNPTNIGNAIVALSLISSAVIMWLVNFKFCFVFSTLLVFSSAQIRKKVDDKIKCPKVKAIRNFDLEQVRLYYARGLF